MIDESATVVAASNGDRGAFGALVCEYQRRAYAVSYSFVGNREDALELSQEAFARAFRAMNRFDPAMPFYPWLYRIIRNTCLNHLKKKQRHGETSLDGLMESGFDVCGGSHNPLRKAELDDLRHCLQQALTQLSPEHQEILRLRHFLELSYEEIAQCLEIPAGTVMSRLHAARKALRRIVERHPAWAEADLKKVNV